MATAKKTKGKKKGSKSSKKGSGTKTNGAGPTQFVDDSNHPTEIVVVLDDSGSMEKNRADTIGTFNMFMEEQRKLATPCTVTLVRFNGYYGVETVYQAKRLADVPALEVHTVGSTPLNDAVGDTIEAVSARLGHLPASERPTVIFLTITDGMGDRIQRRSKAQIKAMIEQYTAAGWVFSYLGANVDAFTEGQTYSSNIGATASYTADGMGFAYAMNAASHSVAALRAAPTMMRAKAYAINNADPRHHEADMLRRSASVLGSKGGQVGGYARAASMTAEERKDSAANAAYARWANTTPDERTDGARKAAAMRWSGKETK